MTAQPFYRHTRAAMKNFTRELFDKFDSLEDNQLIQIALDCKRPYCQRSMAYTVEICRVWLDGFSTYGEVCACIAWADEVRQGLCDRTIYDTISGDIARMEETAREFEQEMARNPQRSTWSLIMKAG